MKPSLAFMAILLGVTFAGAQRVDRKLIDAFGNVPCDDWLGRLDLFLAELQNDPKSSGLIVMYEGRYYDYRTERQMLPVFGEVNLRANLIRSHLRNRRFDPSRITFILGGNRDDHLIELWAIQPGVTYPELKPTRDKIKYRKGKPSSILASCP
jgi:hypothetical protein